MQIQRNKGKLRMQRVYYRLRQKGVTSLRGRYQLDRLVPQIHNETQSMTEALLRAANSQIIEPAFITKLTAMKDNLEMVAATTKTDNTDNKKGDSLQLVRDTMFQLDEAVQHFAY